MRNLIIVTKNIITFTNDGKYNIESPQLPYNLALFSYPNIGGKWEFNDSEQEIKFSALSIQNNLPINGFEYYWKVLELTHDVLLVDVYDKDKKFIHQRKFYRKN